MRLIVSVLFLIPTLLWAADNPGMSATGGVLKMVLGLAVVLGIMALVTWLLKRMMPGVSGHQSVVRIVGGVSVGTRERVVVLEVAGRWLVVGVAPGQVSAIANLEVSEEVLGKTENATFTDAKNISTPSFSAWLNKSVAKFGDNKNAG